MKSDQGRKAKENEAMLVEFRNSDLIKEVIVTYHDGEKIIINDAFVIDQFEGLQSYYHEEEKNEYFDCLYETNLKILSKKEYQKYFQVNCEVT